MRKIGIVGNKFYVNKTQLKNFLWMLKQQADALNPPEEIEIISLGRKIFIDNYIKKLTHLLGFKYSEFLPYHDNWNPNCVENAFMFKKEYSPKYFFIAYSNLIKYSDTILILDTDEGQDSTITYIKKMCKKNKKHYIILKV